MKLYYSAASPFVRKVSVCAIELGLDSKIERKPAAAHPVNRDATLVADNPLGKVPTLVTDDGMALYDSRVICEYLDMVAGKGQLFPADPAARLRAIQGQATADGLLDAGILVRYEGHVRPEGMRWDPWRNGQMEKIRGAVDALARDAAEFGDRVDIGTVSAACALGWLDFRFADMGWRQGRDALAGWFDAFARRPSMQQTQPNA